MNDDSDLEQHIKKLLESICKVMQQNGYQEVSIGAMMRLVGVDAKYAKKHDNVYMQLEPKEEFGIALESIDSRDHSMFYNSDNTTLH
jgi:hypothetical protein